MASGSGTRRALGVALILALALLAVLRSHLGTRLDGFTVDEPWHTVAGVSYLRTGDFRLNPEHPPLVKLAAGAAMPDTFVLPAWEPIIEKSQEREWVEAVMYYKNDSDAALAASRRGVWIFHAMLLVVLGGVLWRAFGLPWSAGTLAFLAIDPTVAAHLPVVMTDLPLALLLALSVACGGMLVTKWSWGWTIATGVAVGLALGSKHSALPGLAGLALGLAVSTLWGLRQARGDVLKRFGKLVLAALLSIVVLWGQYGFRFHAGPDGSDDFNRAMPDKIADLNIDHWREGIGFADRYHLLPRAYLWGLADTVRAGIEGRGQSSHFVWGVDHKGDAPWYTWPAILVAKLPLALLALSLVGIGLLACRAVPLTSAGGAVLGLALAVAAAHLWALVGAQGTYGGIRHALPIVVLLALPAGAVLAWAWASPARWGKPLALAPLVLALAMTLPERRVWEYHNELVGGSENAYRYFGNEGLDLGQRFNELRKFHDEVIKPEGSDFYSSYWFGEEQAISRRMNYRRQVESLEDDNVDGVFEGYFIYGMSSTLPWPDYGWDPEVSLRGLEPVQRFGYLIIYKGRREDPKARASALYGRVAKHLYEEGGGRDALVAEKLEEVVAAHPHHLGAAVELGNAYLRLGNAQAATRAYGSVLTQQRSPVEPLVRRQIEAQLAAIAATRDLSRIKPLRNPWME